MGTWRPLQVVKEALKAFPWPQVAPRAPSSLISDPISDHMEALTAVSDNMETLGVLDRLQQLLLQSLLLPVLGQQKMVEARVRRWQP